MATTVNNAFSEFLRNTVNLDCDNTTTARVSRDNLISNINAFLVTMISSMFIRNTILSMALSHGGPK